MGGMEHCAGMGGVEYSAGMGIGAEVGLTGGGRPKLASGHGVALQRLCDEP